MRMRRAGWRRAVAIGAAGALVLVAGGCGSDDDGEGQAKAPASFCQVEPRFAERLNMALANADPDKRQYESIGGILRDLAPMLRELRAAEPTELDGTVDTWRSNMETYARNGVDGLQAAEAARARMADWVTNNC